MTTNHSGILSWLSIKRYKAKTPALGQRELELLDILWLHEPLTVHEISEHLDSHISISTLQSTLERLYRKEIVSREKSGRSYVYKSLLSRKQLITHLMHDISSELGQDDMQAMISGFIDFVAEKDQDEAQKISRLISNKDKL